MRLFYALGFLLLFSACAGEQPAPLAEAAKVLPPAPKPAPSDTPAPLPTDTLPPIDTMGTTRKKERPQSLPPTFSVVDSVVNLGEVPADTLIKLQFDFANTGDKPLEISAVDRSCGCTAASFPFLPIVKGEKQSIKAEFNSKGKTGKQRIRLTVQSNDPLSPHTLYIQATIKAASK